jgi:hypothetical protein
MAGAAAMVQRHHSPAFGIAAGDAQLRGRLGVAGGEEQGGKGQ